MFKDEYKAKFDSVSPDPAFRRRLEERMENMRGRNRKSVAFRTAIVVLAAMLALTAVGFATGAFQSVFGRMKEFYAKSPSSDYEHMEQMANSSAEMQTVRFESDVEAKVGIAQSYYNGKQLALGWVYATDGTKGDFFDRADAPSNLGEDMADMVNIPDLIGVSNFEQFQTKLDADGWAGFEWFSCYPGDHVYLADAQKTIGADGYEHVSDDALFYPETSASWNEEGGLNVVYEEFETPLPGAAQDQDPLTIARKMYCQRCWVIADGDKVYTGREPAERIELTFGIVRSEDYAQTEYAAEAQFRNHTATIQLTRTPIRAEFSVKNVVSDEWKEIWSAYGGYLHAPLNLAEDLIFDYEILVDGKKVIFDTDSFEGVEGMNGWFLLPTDAKQVAFRPVYANTGANAAEDVVIDLK